MATLSINTLIPLGPYLDNLLNTINVRELFEYESTPLSHNLSIGLTETVEQDVKYRISVGIIPNNVIVFDESNGTLKGTVIDIDSNGVYPPCIHDELLEDGSNYGKCDSANEGQHDFEFTIEAYAIISDTNIPVPPTFEVTDSRDFIIKVVNNYSSDRDQYIRDYSEKFGEDDGFGNKLLFAIIGVPSTADDYIAYQQTLGNFPPL